VISFVFRRLVHTGGSVHILDCIARIMISEGSWSSGGWASIDCTLVVEFDGGRNSTLAQEEAFRLCNI
jgi:hypothetical protein